MGTRSETEWIAMSVELYWEVFNTLDQTTLTGDQAGKIATTVQKAFDAALREEGIEL